MKHLFTHDPIGDSMATLWPPLGQVRAELLGSDHSGWTETPVPDHGSAAAEAPCAPRQSHPASGPREEHHLLGPLLDLAQRRQGVRTHFGDHAWEPGCVVLAQHGNAHLGVLLDRQDNSGAFWNGWLTTAEPDWAGWHDVLLEPDDEPADPSVSVIQTWNRVRIPTAGGQASRVLAQLAPERLAAVRAVWAESLKPAPQETEPAPGRVALRETANGHMVLTGTPLGIDDPRHDHQTLYRDLGQRLIEACQTTRPPEGAKVSEAPQTRRAIQTPPPLEPTSTAPVAPPTSWWSRILNALRPHALWRPAFALLVLVVAGQQWMLWQGGQDDEVLFRGVASTAAETPSLLVGWQPSVRVEEVQALLGSLPEHQQISMLPDGRWLIEVNDPAAAKARLSASPLVKSVEGP